MRGRELLDDACELLLFALVLFLSFALYAGRRHPL